MGFHRPAPHLPERRPGAERLAADLPETRSGRSRTASLRIAASCVVIGFSALTMGCAQTAEDITAPVAAEAVQERPAGASQVGVASYYSHRFNGRRMASGGRFDPHSDTIAHRTLPFGTVVRVTNLNNGLSTTGTVQDRGPWTRGRIVDLSPRIARNLDMMRSGIAQVEVVPVEMVEVAEAAD